LVEDLVEQYDIDGIHFDDYLCLSDRANQVLRVKIPQEKYHLPDETLADWRRRNVNELIQDISLTIRTK
jgi:uncharacterized lipoprotein YddW (UPF0748 family)